MNEEEEVRVPKIGKLEVLAKVLNNKYKVYARLEESFYVHSEPSISFVASLEGDNKLGKEIKEKVEKFLGIKLKAAKEVLAEGMIEFSYESHKFSVRLDKAMTCKKVGTEEKEVEYKVEISPGKDAVMETKKKMAEVAVYKCTEADIEFRGEPE